MIADEHFFSEWKKEQQRQNEASAGAAAQVTNCLLAQYSRRVSWIDPVPSRRYHSTPAHDILMRSCCCCYSAEEAWKFQTSQFREQG